MHQACQLCRPGKLVASGWIRGWMSASLTKAGSRRTAAVQPRCARAHEALRGSAQLTQEAHAEQAKAAEHAGEAEQRHPQTESAAGAVVERDQAARGHGWQGRVCGFQRSGPRGTSGASPTRTGLRGLSALGGTPTSDNVRQANRRVRLEKRGGRRSKHREHHALPAVAARVVRAGRLAGSSRRSARTCSAHRANVWPRA